MCERRKKKKDTLSHSTLQLWTCRLLTLRVDVTQSLIPAGYALPLPSAILGCVLKQCKLRKVMQNRESQSACFTSHPSSASSPENQRGRRAPLSLLSSHCETAERQLHRASGRPGLPSRCDIGLVRALGRVRSVLEPLVPSP